MYNKSWNGISFIYLSRRSTLSAYKYPVWMVVHI